MLRRFIRFSSALVLLLCGNAWALGLGEIRLESSLNSPLRAEIELLSATEEELNNLAIALASAETFERYGLDRSADLQGLEFQIIRSGRTDGNVVRVRSRSPITEPFLTFLVEATWSRGRLLREYTLLLDPPTFAPPTPTQPAVAAPERTTPADSGSIRREPPPRTPVAEPPARAATPPASRPAPAASVPVDARPADNTVFDATPGGDYVVSRNETLWGIAQRVRPDARLSMNQTMLAIYEANRDAFGGNINLLREGASLRIPSADEIFQIERGDALSEVRRQHSAWDGSVAPAAPAVEDSRPNLTLVPPDEDSIGVGADALDEAPLSREEEVERRIAELEADVPVDRALIEIRDNELAALREELARIRGEVYEPPVDEAPIDEAVADDVVADTIDDSPFVDEAPAEELVDDELFPDFDDELVADDAAAEAPADVAAVEDTTAPPAIVRTAVRPTLMDRLLGALTSIWTIIGAALVIAAGVLFWFMRRGRGADEELGPWTSEPLADFESDQDTLSATESLKAPLRDHDGSIVVVEQGSAGPALEDDLEGDTVETPATQPGSGDAVSLEDTFSSETGVNLDQTDPIAEADFHMAYGLYDQAADLINGALAVEPARQDLLTKLCEIYFVWGNRDAFIDVAGRVRAAIGGAGSADWDKIVIMGQQIAADHELFAGAGIAGATKAVDLAFESDTGDAGALDMEFGEDSSGGEVIDLGVGGAADQVVDQVVDLGAADSADDLLDVGTAGAPRSNDDSALDFDFGEDAEDDAATTRESPTIEASMTEKTIEMPAKDSTANNSTVETPTIEQPAADLGAASPGATSELPSIDEQTIGGLDRSQASDQTTEIDLDDLGLDLSGLEETEVASLDDLDETSDNEALEITGVNEALEDSQAATVEQAAGGADTTGMQPALDADSSGVSDALDEIEEALTSTQTGMRLAPDETGVSPFMDTVEDTDTGIDRSLLDATGRTQVLSEELAVEMAAGTERGLGDQDATLLAGLDEADEDDHAATQALGDDDATMLAPGLGEGDFDFAKTEALPPEAFTGNPDLDQTGELPAVASTDVDLDLDDLTAALKISEAGDTVDMPRDDKTVERPRPQMADEYAGAETMALDPDDMSDDLQEARTMTEVGTKLDLARAYVDMGDPGGARSILEEVLDEGDESQRQQAQQLLDTLPG